MKHWVHTTKPAASSGTGAKPRLEARPDPSISGDSVRMSAKLVARVTATDALDRERFDQVVETVVRVRAHQLDPTKSLLREGIGKETIRTGYSPRARSTAARLQT